MFLSLTDFFSEEAAIVKVEESSIDVSDFSDQEDQAFLLAHGQEILRIDAKAGMAKEQICKAIDQKAAEAKGQHIYEIQERFRNNPELKGGLLRYFHSLGYWDGSMERMGLEKPETYTSISAAFNWANAYRAGLEMQEKLAGILTPEEIKEKASSVSANALAKVYTACSEADREAVYQQIAAGEVPQQRVLTELVKRPEVKLNKALEMLEEAKAQQAEAEAQWEEVKDDPDIPRQIDGERNPEYEGARFALKSVNNSVVTLEKKIAQLEAELEAKGAELTKFKFDEELKRQQRVKALTAALTIGVPQTTADLMKFFMDAEYYPAEIRDHLNDQVKILADMCGDYLSKI